MKKLILIVFVLGMVSFYGCSKSSNSQACTDTFPFDDSFALKKYADDSITLTLDTNTGLFYQIIDSGSSVKPTDGSYLTVNYIGRLLNNKIFDSASNSTLNGLTLHNLIIGWRIGLPKIGEGGRIKLLIPSDYAYGCTGYGPVPANAPVYFDITLLSVH